MLIDPNPSISLPLAGLLSGRAPCVRAGRNLLRELAGGQAPVTTPDGDLALRMRPADFADRSDEWWARVCYALALLVELYRAANVQHSRLMSLTSASGAADLLALANNDEVTDPHRHEEPGARPTPTPATLRSGHVGHDVRRQCRPQRRR